MRVWPLSPRLSCPWARCVSLAGGFNINRSKFMCLYVCPKDRRCRTLFVSLLGARALDTLRAVSVALWPFSQANAGLFGGKSREEIYADQSNALINEILVSIPHLSAYRVFCESARLVR